MASALKSTLRKKKDDEKGSSGESVVNGIAYGHARSVHGVVTKELEIGGRRIRQHSGNIPAT